MKFVLTITVEDDKISVKPEGDPVKVRPVAKFLVEFAQKLLDDALENSVIGLSKPVDAPEV